MQWREQGVKEWRGFSNGIWPISWPARRRAGKEEGSVWRRHSNKAGRKPLQPAGVDVQFDVRVLAAPVEQAERQRRPFLPDGHVSWLPEEDRFAGDPGEAQRHLYSPVRWMGTDTDSESS